MICLLKNTMIPKKRISTTHPDPQGTIESKRIRDGAFGELWPVPHLNSGVSPIQIRKEI